MANIVRRSGMQPETRITRPMEWEPFRMLRELFRMDPFEQLMPLAPQVAFVPDFDVKETADAFEFKADLPGVKESDLDISLVGNRLVVSGKREQEERQQDENYFALERSYGSFTRTFTLPEGLDADHVQADLREGVLTMRIPKRPEVQPRKINIKAGGGQKPGQPAKA